ncbi:uncharacterized protein [Misgurnus anguillicaudatus]|uniref:uncharacterized protein n=1 Tax=Misgurnus anguillicaudatus TaxID=75329 RepID=UPI003CCF7BF3
MEKYFSKPYFLQPIAKVDDLSVFKSGRTPLPSNCGKPIAHVDHLIDADLSVFELERTSLSPINSKVQAQQALNLGTPYGETTFQSSMAHNITTEPQLPAAWSIHEIFTEVPKKSRKIIKRTLKEKHISKRSMCHMVQQTVEWVRMLCMDVVLPALLLCLIEEDCMKKEAQLHQKKAGEWIKMNSGEILNRSTEEAKMIGVNIFLCMMDCLHSKNASVRSDAEGSASSQMTSGNSISRETIYMFTADLLGCVYQELLDNDMGKAYPPKYLCSDVSENSSSWEFYWSVLHHFFQQAAKNHVGLFMGLPDILLQDGPSNMEEIWQSCGLETMTNGEKTSLNALTKIVTDIGMNKISDAIEDPLISAEIVRQGKKSLAQYFNVASRREEPERPEVWGSSPKPANPEPENVFNPSLEIQAESLETAEDVQLEEIHGRSSSSMDALLDLDEELEELLRCLQKPVTPEPTKVFSLSAQIQQEPLKSYNVSEHMNLPEKSSTPTRKMLDLDLLDQELDELERLVCSTKLGTPEPKKVVHLPGESSAPTDLLLDDEDSLDWELEELLKSSSKSATPEPTKVYSSKAKIHAESPQSRVDIEVEHTNPAPTDSPPQLENSLHQSRAPTGKCRRKLKNKRKGQGRREKRCREETVKEETSSFRAAELPAANPQGFILPQHFIESVIDGLLTTLQSTYNISVPGLYLYDVLFNKLVQELGNLARVHVVKNIQQLFHNEDEIVLRIVNEAHAIVKDKGYLRAAWQDHEMSVNYLTTVVSAVILDYTVLGGWNQKTDQTEDFAIPVYPNLTVKEKCRNFLSRMRQSLRNVFCFK